MSISVQILFEDVATDFGTGVGDKKLKAVFPRAVNRVLSELSSRANLATKLTLINAISDTISDVDNEHEYIIFNGVRYYLQIMGVRPGDPRIAGAVLKDSSDRWNTSMENYVGDKMQDLDDAAQAGTETDIAGVGDVTNS